MISEELLIKPFGKAVQLIPPNKDNTHLTSIKDVLGFPINAFFQYPNGTIIHYNEHTFLSIKSKELGFYSHRELDGRTFEEFVTVESAKGFIDADKQVIQTNQMMILDEEGILHNKLILSTLSFKFPCYLDKNKPPFIFGLSIVLDKLVSASGVSLAEGLKNILSLGLIPLNLDKPLFQDLQEIEGVYVTKRQLECLKWSAKGMSAKKIADKLGISSRTVEHHFENLKDKLKVKSKSELIEKFIDHQLKIQ